MNIYNKITYGWNVKLQVAYTMVFLFFPIKNSMVFLDSGIFNETHLEVYINIAKEKK